MNRRWKTLNNEFFQPKGLNLDDCQQQNGVSVNGPGGNDVLMTNLNRRSILLPSIDECQPVCSGWGGAGGVDYFEEFVL